MPDVMVTLATPYNAPFTEAHLAGCKAITRRVRGVETDIGSTMPLAGLLAMQKNPDEGHVKVHSCLKGHAVTTYVPEIGV